MILGRKRQKRYGGEKKRGRAEDHAIKALPLRSQGIHGFIIPSTPCSKYLASSGMPGMLLNELQNRFDVYVPTWNFRTLARQVSMGILLVSDS
jgi:hypothetical protein